MQIETRYLFYRSSDSVEGAAGDPAKVSPRGYHEGHSSRSLFQLFFLLPLVDSEAVESTVTNFPRHTTISRVLSGDTNCLGLKSPRVTNVNHEINNMHKRSSGGLLSFLNSLSTHKWIWQIRSITH